MRELVKTGCGKRADHLGRHAQHSVGWHWAVGRDPRSERLTRQVLRNVGEVSFFLTEIKGLGNVDVTQLLSSARLLLKLRLSCRIDTRGRDERQGDCIFRSSVS